MNASGLKAMANKAALKVMIIEKSGWDELTCNGQYSIYEVLSHEGSGHSGASTDYVPSVSENISSVLSNDDASQNNDNSDNSIEENIDSQSGEGDISNKQMVFARKKSKKYFYPAVVENIHDDKYRVKFLDDSEETVSDHDVYSVDDAFSSLKFQANWLKAGLYFKGEVTRGDTLTMHYNDGAVEEIELHQLRGY